MIKGGPGTQLRLFMDPEEHIASIQGSSDAFPEHMDAMWSSKEWQARQPADSGVHGAGLYDSIKEKGVTSHVHVFEDHRGKLNQGEGHHRAAAARAVQRDTGNPQFLPVNYIPQDVRKYPGSQGFKPGPS